MLKLTYEIIQDLEKEIKNINLYSDSLLHAINTLKRSYEIKSIAEDYLSKEGKNINIEQSREIAEGALKIMKSCLNRIAEDTDSVKDKIDDIV